MVWSPTLGGLNSIRPAATQGELCVKCSRRGIRELTRKEENFMRRRIMRTMYFVKGLEELKMFPWY
jgi:hypothetical protein